MIVSVASGQKRRNVQKNDKNGSNSISSSTSSSVDHQLSVHDNRRRSPRINGALKDDAPTSKLRRINESSTPSRSVSASDESFASSSPPTENISNTIFIPKSELTIPRGIPPKNNRTYAKQCVAAAYNSRLNPYELHVKEQESLQDHLCHAHVTVYLNIRNRILHTYLQNPNVSVTRQQALGCARDYRWNNLASFAYDWLLREGYINFGCVEVPQQQLQLPLDINGTANAPIIVVVGAGMAGLGCARHLEGLFHQYRQRCRVIVVEGKERIGGRIHSVPPLKNTVSTNMPPPPAFPSRVDIGAEIVVGFEGGNPLDVIIRNQLSLPCQYLNDISTIYDVGGLPVNKSQDKTDEKLYNDILECASFYHHQPVIAPTAQGNKKLIKTGRDSYRDDSNITVRQYLQVRAAERLRRTATESPDEYISKQHPASGDELNLDSVAHASETQTLGAVIDEGVKRYQSIHPLTCKDMRLLNWHYANMEYANAANVNDISLSLWNQDDGNEFEGEHCQIIGGYEQVPYALYSFPNELTVRTDKKVSKISYDLTGTGEHEQKTLVQCDDGETIMADQVVFTGSLGVLKHQLVQFDPPLPLWKTGAIERLGFGLLNKVILVFRKPFWGADRDMFGVLREPEDNKKSLKQEDYSANRGKCYMFWNCLKSSGLPILIGIFAGDAAYQVENMPDHEITSDAINNLRNIFGHAAVPDPLETIITRWSTKSLT